MSGARYLQLGLILIWGLVSASVLAGTHVGSHNPLTEAWVVTSGDSGVGGAAHAPDADYPDVYAWQINSNASGRLRYESAGPQSADSWVYSARMRVVNLNDAVDAGLILEAANGSRRFLLLFGSDTDGATLIDLAGDDFPALIDLTIPSTAPGITEYVHVEVVFLASAGFAEVFVNGQLMATAYTGVAGSQRRVNFGDGGNDDVGPGRFAAVDFQVGLPACADGIDNDGDGAVDFAGGDGDCQSAHDTTESIYCPVGEDVDGDGICERIVVLHERDAEPGTEGWVRPTETAGQQRAPGDEDVGAGNCEFPCAFWRIIDAGTASGNLGTYTLGSFPAEAPGGWEYRARVRTRAMTEGVAEGPTYAKTMFARFPEGANTREFGALFGITAEGDMLLRPSGQSGSGINIGPADLYHEVRVVYDPATGTADILVDGELLVENSTGRLIANFSERAAHWGSAASGATGRTHWHEVAVELDPDTDNDGLANVAEPALGTDPYLADTDDDGLADGAEVVAGTQPTVADSDGDELLDGYEVTAGLDPLTPDGNTDLDGDGLDNLQEQEAGTQPQVADTDADGLSDGEEVLELGTNPLMADSDGDGLSDGDEELTHGTDPTSVDTDGDGLLDADELTAGTGPVNPDTDGDGSPDGVEQATGTNPLVADTDGDGLDDGFEAAYGFDPLVAGEASLDTDGDGLTNLAEQTAGTSPNEADTDGDGLSDGAEVNAHGTDPTSVDGDGDGLLDSFELAAGFNPNSAGEETLDADNDGLSNLEEQTLGLNPAVADTDGDGYLDGEETYIFGTAPQLSNPPALALTRTTQLEFEATDQPLFENLPDPTFVDLAPLVAEQTGGTISAGNVRSISRPKSTITVQDVWDEAVATCQAQSITIPVSSYENSCRNLVVRPTRNECINGGNVSYASRSITCCETFAGDINILGNISSCNTGTFNINDVNNLPGGPYVSPTTVNVGPGAGPRPTSDTALPNQNYQIGAEITQTVGVTGGLTLTPGLSSADPGDVDLYYDTDARVTASRSVVAPGEEFSLSLAHTPKPFSGAAFDGTSSNCTARQSVSSGSCMSSRWPDFQTSITLDIGIDLTTDAEIWSIDPDTGDQLHITRRVHDESVARSYELAAFDWRIGDSLDLRLLNNVPAVPAFVQQDISISSSDVFGLWDPGTQLPIPVDIPFGCFLKKISTALCVTLGIPDTSGVSTNLMTFQLQIPELNAPVSQADPFVPLSEGFNGGEVSLFSTEKVVPLRHHINEYGELMNTVPNKFRPKFNLSSLDGSAEGVIDTFIRNSTDLSSDVFRYELDLDGIVCINSGGTACLGASAGIPFVAELSLDALDLDLVLWTGWDSTTTFSPNLQARLVFSRDVQVWNDTLGAFEMISAGQPKLVDVPADTQIPGNVRIIQPDGGVDVSVQYSFAGNTFTSRSNYEVKLGAETSYMRAEMGGFLGALYEAAVGLPWRLELLKVVSEAPPIPAEILSGTYTLSGPQMEFAGPMLRIVDAGTDSDEDGLDDDLENAWCTSANDADSDDDGLPDGIEDVNRNGVVDAGETSPCLADSDGDGLQDGAERGLVTPHADTLVSAFVPNATPLIRTDPSNPDTDNDGVPDGVEVAAGSDPRDDNECPPGYCESGILKIIQVLGQDQ